MNEDFQNGLVVGIYVALFFVLLVKLMKRVEKLEKVFTEVE